MLRKASRLWLNSSGLFDPVQHFFNGDFWTQTSHKFHRYLSGRILDLACGTGELADHIQPTSYLGVDLNGKYIDYAKTNRQRGSFITADITELTLKEVFDTVTIISATHHLSDAQIQSLSRKISKIKFKYLLVIDGLPKRPFAGILKYLDDKLGGGNNFRSEQDLAKIFGQYFTIIESGNYQAHHSFYYYPYLVATATKP